MRRVKLAEQEARLDLLRNRAKTNKSTETTTSSAAEHVNFFSEVEDGKYISPQDNADHVKEKKDEQEKYEKQIGYLTYLGQDTNELEGKRNWYDVLPNRSGQDQLDEGGRKIEVNLKSKLLYDPLAVMQRYLGTSSFEKSSKETNSEPVKSLKYESVIGNISSMHDRHSKKSKKRKSKKHKKEKKSKKSKRKSSSESSSEDEVRRKLQRQKVEALRIERIKREKVERERAEKLLAKIRGEPEVVEKKPPPDPSQVKQKYNSQFNPDIARQNIE